MTNRRPRIVLFLACLALWPGCGPDGPAGSTLALVRRAHEQILTVDSDCWAAAGLMEPGWRVDLSHPGSRRFDLPRMAEGGLDAAFFKVSVRQGVPADAGYAEARAAAAAAIEAVVRMTASHPQLIVLGRAPQDAYKAEKLGRRAAFIGLENGWLLGEDVFLLEAYHTQGVRMLTLCGERDNLICDAAADREHPGDRGLSDLGRRVVAECNRLGIIIDLAHASPRSFFDVLAATRAPVVVSHAGVRALCGHPENLTDEMLSALAKAGGTVQVCLEAEKLARPRGAGGRTRRAGLDDFVEHVGHAVKLIGPECVGIATSFDGGGGVAGCEDAGRLLNVTLALLRRGYGEQALEAMWGGNLMRVFERVRQTAERPRQ